MATDRKPDLRVVPSGQDGRKAPETPPLIYTPGYSLYNEAPASTRWLIEHLIPRGCTFCVNGRGGILKSWLFTEIGIAVASGKSLMGRFKVVVDPPFNSVLYVQLEEERDESGVKYRYLLHGHGMKPQQIMDLPMGYIIGQAFRVDSPKQMDQMKIMIEDLRPDLVLWDNARKMKRGNANDSEWADEIAFALKQLQQVYPSTHGLIHHWRKKAKETALNDPSEMGAGTAALRDAMSVWLPVQLDEMGGFLTMYHDKCRGGAKLRPFNYRVAISDRAGAATVEYVGSADAVSTTGCGSAIVDLLNTDPKRIWKKPDIETALTSSYSKDQIKYGIRALEFARTVTVEPSRGRNPTLIALRSTLSEQLETNPTVETEHNQVKPSPVESLPYKD